jgi:hypothetical protein
MLTGFKVDRVGSEKDRDKPQNVTRQELAPAVSHAWALLDSAETHSGIVSDDGAAVAPIANAGLIG